MTDRLAEIFPNTGIHCNREEIKLKTKLIDGQQIYELGQLSEEMDIQVKRSGTGMTIILKPWEKK